MTHIMFIAMTLFLSMSASVQAQDEAAELVEKLTAELDLTASQREHMKAEIIDFRNSVDQITTKYEGEEEPDVVAMVAEIREVRQGYLDKVEEILNPNQFKKYVSLEDIFITDMFNDLASIRLMDVQPRLDLTDNQVEDLTPIVGTSMKKTMNVLFENAGLPLTFNRKLGIGKELRTIEKEKRESMEKILSPDQFARYDAYREEMKNNLKQ
jgi:hypothetical protein